ncbi:MAG: phosphonate ABC transporter, permease protein PhnE [Clostridia bacterium]|nr:phosphonate ABC transporter, permease protein PhnE [Clostridia bacterium]
MSPILTVGVVGVILIVLCLPASLFAGFDFIFKPEVIVLKNGHRIVRKRSRVFLIAAILIIVVIAALKMTDFDFSIIVERGYQLGNILKKIATPKWSYWRTVLEPLFETIKMSVMGSVVGSALALPFAVFASTNINKNGFIVSVLRIILNIVRTLPTLVIASICALIFRLGSFAGTIAIAVFTFGIVAKMLYESIETIDMGPFEAMESLGASKFQAFWSACMPQILPTYLSHCLYSFEINIRAASILGYVGAGGLGILIQERISWRDYESLGTLLIMLFVVVLIIENVSQHLRRKLS